MIHSSNIKTTFLLFCLLVVGNWSTAQQSDVEVSMIWNKADHSAFTDLVWFDDMFYCTFREGVGHIPRKDDTGDGLIRVIASKDGKEWNSVALIEKEGLDLRDPKLSITPENKLMLLFGGVNYDHRKVLSRESYVVFSNKKGSKFSKPKPIKLDWNRNTEWTWLWRVSWVNGTGYGGIFYEPANSDAKSSITRLALITTSNGKDYKFLKELDIDGSPNESSMKILENGEARMIVRREGGDKLGYFGSSKAPYVDWTWTDLGMRIGGPEFIVLPSGQLVFGSRKHLKNGAKTSIYIGDEEGHMKEVFELPSGGDTSYPGMVWKENKLYVSYYSSHEGKTSIYFAVMDGSKLIN